MTQAEILKARTFDFSVAVFRRCRPLMRDPETRVPAGQLVRASASVAANYRASCRAKSKRDFIAKLGTVIEESVSNPKSAIQFVSVASVSLAGAIRSSMNVFHSWQCGHCQSSSVLR